MRAIEKDDQQAAQDVLALKDDEHRMVDRALQLQVSELTAERPVGIDAFRLEMEAADKLKPPLHSWSLTIQTVYDIAYCSSCRVR